MQDEIDLINKNGPKSTVYLSNILKDSKDRNAFMEVLERIKEHLCNGKAVYLDGFGSWKMIAQNNKPFIKFIITDGFRAKVESAYDMDTSEDR
jgi:nucleoid DNA-binding protein